jgi:NAD(P)-dependent dehydrogenase (short-subunit alcohol dehydrogenase family)
MTDRIVIITGAVGNLGAAVARAFHGAESKTVLVDRSSDRLRKAYPQLADSPNHLLGGDIDLTDAEGVVKLMNSVHERFGRIDALINTVGTYQGGKRVHEDDLDRWDFLFRVNLRTTLLTCRAAIPYFLNQGSGRIINVAARAGLVGNAGMAAYCAAKSAVIRLTESLSAELKGNGITVNCILPGTLDTAQNRAAMPNADHSTWVPPAAIADVILFLASDGARAVTGAAIPVYGRS